MELDYIIVGRGIAGCMLSFFLLKQHKKILVIDVPSTSASTYVAAGVLNPITGRRMVKSWMVDELLPAANQAYRELEELLQQKIWHPKKMLRILPTDVEKQDAIRKSTNPETMHYIAGIYNEINIRGINKSFAGACEINGSGYVDTALLLKLYGDYLLKNNALKEEDFDFSQLEIIDNKTISYKNYQSKKIIFCEGYKAKDNPYFGHLPIISTKGELLTIHAPELQTDKIISKGIYIVPIGNQVFKVGATYEWIDLSELSTAKGKEELITKLDKIIDVPYQVLQQEAGIRPAVKDRRPLIGLHPEFTNIGIFNGLGTKGMMLAPYFAKHFADVLEEKENLLPEVDIKRYE